MKLKSLQLNTQSPQQAIDYYTTVMGMTLINNYESDTEIIYELQYPNTDTCLELISNLNNTHSEAYQEARMDNYWKYSVFVDDIQQAYRFLNKKQILTKEPYQFRDIGYLMHTKDIENYQIEFIQRTFQQNTPKHIIDSNISNNIGQPSLGLITIRTQDPLKSIRFFESVLDLKLLARMYVPRGNGFTLFFLGDKNLTPPNMNIDAIENREWLYHQKDLFLEIQYYWGTEYQEGFKLNANLDKRMGLNGIKLQSGNLERIEKALINNQIEYTIFHGESKQKKGLQFYSPDKQLIKVEIKKETVGNQVDVPDQ